MYELKHILITVTENTIKTIFEHILFYNTPSLRYNLQF